MAIKLTYGDVSGYAKLGVLAGKAKADTTAMQLQAAADRQVMDISARNVAQGRQQQHQKEMQEFDAYMDNIRYQSGEAWELEKMELRSRHDFDMLEARREADFMSDMQREQRQKQEMDVKLKAIREAEHLSDREKEIATLRVQTGVGIQADRPAGKGSALAEAYASIQRTGQPIPGYVSPIKNPEVETARAEADRTKDLRAETTKKAKEIEAVLSKLSKDEQTELRAIIAEGNPTKIDKARRLLEPEINTKRHWFAFPGGPPPRG